MMNKETVKFYRKQAGKWTDAQLTLHIRELQELKKNEEVFNLCLWNDINKILEILHAECVRRLETRTNE